LTNFDDCGSNAMGVGSGYEIAVDMALKW
jgi:hypothetical protein